MLRKPRYAGHFYEGDADALNKQIETCFLDKEHGPGEIPHENRRLGLKGVIAPHAGYTYSGPAQAWVYKAVAEAKIPNVYVIIGVNHSSPETCSCSQDWENPLGTVRCDIKLAEALEKKGIPINNDLHSNEHSIEVQLPFLQYSAGKDVDKIRIVPIMISDDNPRWAEAITNTLKETGKTAVIICSSDFTHYGRAYDYIPFHRPEGLAGFDNRAIKHILDNDLDGFKKFCEDTGATICGRHGINTLVRIMKTEQADGKLLKYYNSGDITGERDNAVGYAAITFTKN